MIIFQHSTFQHIFFLVLPHPTISFIQTTGDYASLIVADVEGQDVGSRDTGGKGEVT